MAVVTLGDLMNPLVKIEEYTKKTSEKLDSLIGVISGINRNNTVGAISSNSANDVLTISLQEAMVEQLTAQTLILRNIKTLLGKGKFDDKESDADSRVNRSKNIEDLNKLGIGIGSISKSMLIFSLVKPKTLTKFVTFVKDLFESLVSQKPNEVKQGVESFVMLGGGILKFVGSLAISSVLLIPGMVAIPFLITSITILGITMVTLSKFSTQIKKGARSLDRIGDSLVSFAIGLASFALSSLLVITQPKILIGMVSSIVLVGGAIALIGALSSPIRKGSLSLGLMSISLVGFSLSYLLFRTATKDLTLEDVGIQAAVIGSLAAVFGLAGIPVIAGAIALGSIAIGLVGVSLLALSAGLSTFKKVNFTEENSKSLAYSLSSIRIAFLGTSGKNDGIFSKLGNAIGGVIDSGAMLAGAVAYAAAGASLIAISSGLLAIKKVDFTEEDSMKMSYMLGSISAAFAQAGGEPSNPGGLFGSIFGTAFSPNAVERGVKSVLGAGKSLIDVSEGLIEFQSIISRGINIPSLVNNIKYTLGLVGDAFAGIGEQRQTKSIGLFGKTLISWDQNKVLKGINSVEGAGKSLTNISEGLINYQKLVTSKVNWDTLGDVIAKSIGFVGSAFAQIGEQRQEKKVSLFGIPLISWDQNKVLKGINSVKGAGNELLNIANSLIKFQGITGVKTIGVSISDAITSIGSSLVKIYESDPYIEKHMSSFNLFLNQLSKYSDDSLLKTSKGIQSISDAISSFDLERIESVSGLFSAAVSLNTNPNSSGFRLLAQAVNEIRDILLVDTGTPITSTVDVGQFEIDMKPLSDSLSRIDRSLATLNSTMNNLPGYISSIQIKIPSE